MGIDLATKAKDTLDVPGETTLALLLHLVIQWWEGHMVKSKIKEQGLAGDWLEFWRELDQIRLFSNKGSVEAESFQAVAERLNEGGRSKKVNMQSQKTTNLLLTQPSCFSKLRFRHDILSGVAQYLQSLAMEENDIHFHNPAYKNFLLDCFSN